MMKRKSVTLPSTDANESFGPRDHSISDCSMTNIFAYGTLRCPLVRFSLLEKHHHTQEPAFVKGFSIHPVTHGSYPAVVPSSDLDNRVNGTLILDVDETDMAILDLFEDEYIHHQVLVYSSPESEPIAATLYLWNLEESLLDNSMEWSYENDFELQTDRSTAFRKAAANFRQDALSVLERQSKQSE